MNTGVALLYSSAELQKWRNLYRSARDGYGFEADWSEFYTTTRKPLREMLYTQAECNSRFITGIRLGGLSICSDIIHYSTGQVMSLRVQLTETVMNYPIQLRQGQFSIALMGRGITREYLTMMHLKTLPLAT